MARLTVRVVDVVDVVGYVNKELARIDSTVDGRQAMMILAEQILHDAGCYKGFYYLSNFDLPESVKPGIRYFDDHLFSLNSFSDTDQTRVQYFL